MRHLGCYRRALEISSHPTEQFICWKEVESAFCPAPPGSAKGFIVGDEPVHEEAKRATQSLLWASCAASSALPSQEKAPAEPEVTIPTQPLPSCQHIPSQDGLGRESEVLQAVPSSNDHVHMAPEQ